MLLIEKCKEKRAELHISNGQIAEKSGIPLSTVNAFFSGAVKNPSMITGGAICAVLGVSLDALFGIKNDEMDARERARIQAEYDEHRTELQQRIEAHAQDILLHEVTIANNEEIIRRQDLRIAGLDDRIRKQCTAIIIHRLLIFSFAAYGVFVTYLLMK